MTDAHDRFTSETTRHRRELRAYCYRMVGSPIDAEDLVQDVYLRAWRAYAGFERRASIRAWLYRIATNVCLTALESRRVRVLPSGLGAAHDGDRPPTEVADAAWLEPLPDAWFAPVADDPAGVVIARESLRLALIASLQYLPARQRAILILRETLAFSADETAEMLATTTAAVKSGLQRARARLDELMPDREALLEPTDPRARALLDGYMAAFERSDAALLVEVLRADATLEATPFRDWRAGRARCIELLASHVLGTAGDWQMSATIANGQLAALVHRRDAAGAMRANGIVVLAATAAGVAQVVAFHHDPSLLTLFG
ncbi:MAG: RNA polymerase subunit sigma-70 [Deltaproteobacteria bacterium]|nr:RNA polymerase subunit sigma-70 [Deltaproteobacteria bacterium]